MSFSHNNSQKIAVTKLFGCISLHNSIINLYIENIKEELTEKGVIDIYTTNLSSNCDSLISTTLFALCCLAYKSSIKILFLEHYKSIICKRSEILKKIIMLYLVTSNLSVVRWLSILFYCLCNNNSIYINF